MKYCGTLIVCAIFIAIGCAEAKAATAEAKGKDEISNYLADVSATPVSAGDLVGVSGSAITNIQSAQDLTLAISPLSSGSGQGGFGLAITPARTSISPMSGEEYANNRAMRLLGATTISYAANTSTIAGASYRKSAASIDTAYYWNRDDDPIIRAANLFAHGPGACYERKVKDDELAVYVNKPDKEIDERKVKELEQAAVTAWANCLKSKANEAKWNATKLFISAGAGWIKPDATGGVSQSLGRSVVLGGILESGEGGAIYVTVRHIIGEIDLKTLAGTPVFSNSNLAGIRFTQGMASDSTLRFLAEVSNVKSNPSTATVSNTVFKYAVGFDKKLANGIWAEFRLGRNRTVDDLATQTTSLLNLNWSPTSTLPIGGKSQ